MAKQLVKSQLVMMAQKYNPGVFEGTKTFYVTEKVLGVRVYYDVDEKSLCTKSGKALKCPVEWLERLSEMRVSVEGYLNLGDDVGETRKVVHRNTRVAPLAWMDRGVKFFVQDIRKDAPFEVRMNELNDLATPDFIVKSTYTQVENDAEVKAALSQSTHGLVLKNAAPTYLHRRTKHMMHVQQVFEEAATINSVVEGKNKQDGKIGHLTCTLLNGSHSEPFRVSSGFTADQRDLDYYSVGDIVTIQFSSTSKSGSPRFAILNDSSTKSSIKRPRKEETIDFESIIKRICEN